jgi:hypothetical protein
VCSAEIQVKSSTKADPADIQYPAALDGLTNMQPKSDARKHHNHCWISLLREQNPDMGSNTTVIRFKIPLFENNWHSIDGCHKELHNPTQS